MPKVLKEETMGKGTVLCSDKQFAPFTVESKGIFSSV